MAKAIINGEVISGSTSYASAIEYTKEDGTKSTVQNELDELNSKSINIIDSFDSESSKDGLSANCGRILKDSIDSVIKLLSDAGFAEGYSTTLNGSYSMHLGGGVTGQQKMITFDPPFIKIPKVTYSVSGETSKLSVSTSNITRTSVTFNMSNGGSSGRDFTVTWNATTLT